VPDECCFQYACCASSDLPINSLRLSYRSAGQVETGHHTVSLKVKSVLDMLDADEDDDDEDDDEVDNNNDNDGKEANGAVNELEGKENDDMDHSLVASPGQQLSNLCLGDAADNCYGHGVQRSHHGILLYMAVGSCASCLKCMSCAPTNIRVADEQAVLSRNASAIVPKGSQAKISTKGAAPSNKPGDDDSGKGVGRVSWLNLSCPSVKALSSLLFYQV
jgi:hypothetical protein